MYILGSIAAFISALTWAIGITAYSKLTNHVEAYKINFNRALFATPCFLALIFYAGWGDGLLQLQQLTVEKTAWLTLSMISSYAFADMLFLWSTQDLGVPAAMAIASTYPIWSALAGWVLKGEVLREYQIAGLFSVVFGVVLVVLSRAKSKEPVLSPAGGEIEDDVNHHELHGEKQKNRKLIRGFIFAFATSLFWATNTYSITKGAEGISAGVANTIRMVVAMILCPIVGGIFWPQKTQATGVVKALSFRGLFLSKDILRKYGFIFLLEAFIGAYAFLYGVTHAPMAIAAGLSSLAPVLAVPIALVYKTEKITKQEMVGVCVATIGVLLLVTF